MSTIKKKPRSSSVERSQPDDRQSNKTGYDFQAKQNNSRCCVNQASRKFLVNTDGAIRPDESASGLAAIVRDEQGKILHWWQKRAGRMTNNEAEYAAVIFALEQLLLSQGRASQTKVTVYCDSLLIVNQMQGRAEAHAPTLQQALARLQSLVLRFQKVSFHHVSREHNRLADALAFEALAGWEPQVVKPSTGEPHEEVVEEFFLSWRSS